MRVSYSMLSAWERKDYEMAIGMFLGIQTPTNFAMQAGSALHEEWQKETEATKKLPSIFGAKELKNPQPEIKIVKKINGWLTLSGVIDCLDLPVVYEYKSGKTPASFYARSKQHEVYQILEPRIEVAEYYAYNQYTNTVTFEKIYLGKESLERAYNWVITLASEMKETLERMGYDTEKRIRKV